MSVIHIRHARLTLERQLCKLVDVSDIVDRPLAQQEQMRLTRALAAYAIQDLADLDPQIAAAAVVDGYDDNGIDAIHITPGVPSLWLVQAKWIGTGKGGPELGDVKKFADGVRDLIETKFERFNSRVKGREADLRAALDDIRLTVHVVLAYTGEKLSKHATRDLTDLLEDLNDPSEMAELHILNLKEIHRAIAGGAQGSGVDFNLTLLDWGNLDEPHKAFYGQVPATEIASRWEVHGTKLVTKNLRNFMGETDVNEAVQSTLKNRPEEFWYFNNGITMLCDSVKKAPTGGNSRQVGVFHCAGGSIVNGAQTAGNIAKAHTANPAAVARAKVLIRLLSLEHAPEGYAADITRSTNTQNRIERKDFVALDPEQDRLRTEFQIEGKRYVYKSGEAPVAGADGCNLEEATAALACSSGDVQIAIWSKKEIGKLWERIDAPPYKRLFNSGLTGLRLWRLVVTLREIEEHLRRSVAHLQAPHRRNVAVHGNRFIASLVFSRVDMRNFDVDSTGSILASADIGTLTRYFLDLVDAAATELYPEAMVSRLFYNVTKCRSISASIQERELYAASTRGCPPEPQPHEAHWGAYANLRRVRLLRSGNCASVFVQRPQDSSGGPRESKTTGEVRLSREAPSAKLAEAIQAPLERPEEGANQESAASAGIARDRTGALDEGLRGRIRRTEPDLGPLFSGSVRQGI